MPPEKYKALNLYINQRPYFKNLVVFIDKQFPKPVMWIFYGTLAVLAVRLDIRVIPCGLIPWIDFLIVTLIRNRLNYKRPFEAIGFNPIVFHSSGRSCPSRHASSSVIITIAVYYIWPLLGIITGIISIFVCVSRVLTGVHYIKDVVLGVLISIFIGILSFFIIL